MVAWYGNEFCKEDLVKYARSRLLKVDRVSKPELCRRLADYDVSQPQRHIMY